MEDEQKQPEQQPDQAQKEAREKNALPENVTTTNGDAVADRRSHFDMLEKGKEVAKKYGEPDFATLLAKVGSDGIFAQRLVEDLVTGSENAAKASLMPDSPQERNQTGIMDHTGETPTKQKRDGQTDVPPVVA